MPFPLFPSIYRSPDEPSAGDAEPTKPDDSGTAGAGGGAGDNATPPRTAAAAPSLSAQRAQARADAADPQAKGKADAEPAMPWLKDGKVFDGRFDRDDHAFTEVFVNENPHVRALIESHHQLNREHSAYKRGHYERTALRDEELEALDLTLTDDGALQKSTMDKLLGKPFTPKMGEMFAALLLENGSVKAEKVKQWHGELAERHGESAYDNVIEWLTKCPTCPVDDADLDEIEKALGSRVLRDPTFDKLFAQYLDQVNNGDWRPGQQADGTSPISEDERLQVADTSRSTLSDSDIFHSEQEGWDAYVPANVDEAANRKWQKKADRSPAMQKAMREKMHMR